MDVAIDQLLTIAELGATFAGFTAIAGIFARNVRDRTATKLNFWIMIEFCFFTILFALIPIALMNFDLSASKVWMISSACMAVFIPLHLVFVGRRYIQPAAERGEFDARGPKVMVPLFAVVFLVQVSNAVGIGFQQSYAAYFLGLVFFIILVFANFASVLRQIWLEDDEAQ